MAAADRPESGGFRVDERTGSMLRTLVVEGDRMCWRCSMARRLDSGTLSASSAPLPTASFLSSGIDIGDDATRVGSAWDRRD